MEEDYEDIDLKEIKANAQINKRRLVFDSYFRNIFFSLYKKCVSFYNQRKDVEENIKEKEGLIMKVPLSDFNTLGYSRYYINKTLDILQFFKCVDRTAHWDRTRGKLIIIYPIRILNGFSDIVKEYKTRPRRDTGII